MAGTSDGVPFEELVFFNIPQIGIDVQTNDAVGQGHDQITFESDLVATGLESFFLVTSETDNVDASKVSFTTTQENGIWTFTPLSNMVPGDFNGDEQVDASDIDLLFAAIAASETDPRYDLNSDGQLDDEDATYLIEQILGTRRGDINLDNQVQFSDFVTFSTFFGAVDIGWNEGDFNGDRMNTFADFVQLSVNFGFVAPQGLPGDFDDDGQVDTRDIDLILVAIANSNTDPVYDLNSDGQLDDEDVTYLIEQILGTRRGDIDLDGEVQFSDFVTFSTFFGAGNAGWAEGDFNGDRMNTFADFVQLSVNFGLVAPQRLPAEFDGDRQVDAVDIDLKSLAVANPNADPGRDLDNGQLNDGATYLIERIRGTGRGDIDLNGQVQFSDFVTFSTFFGTHANHFADFVHFSVNFRLDPIQATLDASSSTGPL